MTVCKLRHMIKNNRILKIAKRKCALAYNNQSGMTMVEVMMGFLILSIMMGALSGIMAFSSNMLQNSVDLKHSEERFQEEVYKKHDELMPEATSFNLKVYDQMAGGNRTEKTLGTPLSIEANYYKFDNDNSQEGDSDILNVEVYYFEVPEN